MSENKLCIKDCTTFSLIIINKLAVAYRLPSDNNILHYLLFCQVKGLNSDTYTQFQRRENPVVVIMLVDTSNNYLILLPLLSPQCRRSQSSHYYALFSSVTKIDSVTFSLPPSYLLSDACLSTLAIHVSIPELGKIFIWKTY